MSLVNLDKQQSFDGLFNSDYPSIGEDGAVGYCKGDGRREKEGKEEDGRPVSMYLRWLE